MDPQAHEGGRVGSWVLERELGRGGFGAVHRAHHAVHGTPAAVKLFLGATEPDEAIRVEREAQALAGIQHPGIVRLLDHGRAGRGWFLVMELVDGLSLDELVRRGGPLAAPEAARLTDDFAALDNRGKARLQRGDLDGAEADLTRALQLQPRHVEARVNLGMLRAQRGDVALAELDHAVELEPRSARAWTIRGVLRSQQGDAGGREDLERALTLVPRGDPSRVMIENALVEARKRLGR